MNDTVRLREENERMRKALQRIHDIVCADGSLGEVSRWYHPQYGSLTSEGEAEIRRLVKLALKAPASDR